MSPSPPSAPQPSAHASASRPAASRPAAARPAASRPLPSRPPSVERVLEAVRSIAPDGHAREAVLAESRAAVERERARLAGGNTRTRQGGEQTACATDTLAARSPGALAAEVVERLSTAEGRPDPIVNATGVIVHTNLGRAPWPAVAIEAAAMAARRPLFLEFDATTGRRGRRFRAAEDLLVALTGAGDALVVNNNAAAVALAIGLAGRGAGVAVSRGELVEIGGGVRIPDIVRRAGARLVEVGTTNRTRVEDFREPLASGRVQVVLRVHPSNFRQEGFVESPDAPELAALARAHGAIVVDDLGSGALLDTARFGLAHEPMPGERLRAGSDVVTFSGDKLLGGPQAGLIVGRADLVTRLRRDPLARAVRADKVTLAALAATLDLYRRGLAEREIPVWQMIGRTPEELRRRAEAIRDAAGVGEVVEVESTVGGGSLPGELLFSFGLAIVSPSADRLLRALRTGRPPVVGRVESGRVLLDLRTVDPAGDDDLAAALRAAVGEMATVREPR